MNTMERRKVERTPSSELKRELNDNQLMTLQSLEQVGWQIKFIRRPENQAKIAVVSDGMKDSYGEIEADGTLNERHEFRIR
jgi:hypothetical protein